MYVIEMLIAAEIGQQNTTFILTHVYQCRSIVSCDFGIDGAGHGDTGHGNEYNRRVRGWIDQFLQTPGAVSFVAFRTADGASPNTITMLEFHTVEEARRAVTSQRIAAVLHDLRSVGTVAKVLLVERSPFTPEPIRA
jgi:hypothetical protein